MTVSSAGGDGVGGDGANGTGEYRTFTGGGFGTVMLQIVTGEQQTPGAVSTRERMRGALPALYREDDFGMRFVGALEEVLDPIVALLDALPQHFDPDYAPRDVLDGMSAWLGVELDEGQTLDQRRELVRRAAELGRRRGTTRGLELALALAFPGVPLRVEDAGKVTWSLDPAAGGDDVSEPRFVVYCDEPQPEERQAAIARCIEQVKPAHVAYRLRVKAPPREAGET